MDKESKTADATPLPEQQRGTDEWRLQWAMEDATAQARAASGHLGETLKRLADPRADKAAVTESAEAAMESVANARDALSQMRVFWLRLVPRLVVEHPRVVLGGAAGAMLLAVAVWFFWPTQAPAVPPTAATVKAVDPAVAIEERVAKLCRASEFAAAEKILSTEYNCPRGWHMRGEIERMKGDEPAAQVWYKRAAAAGDELAARALKVTGYRK